MKDIFYLDDRLFDDQHQPFDDVGQLPHIAGPGLIFEEIPDFDIEGMGSMITDIQAFQQRLGNLLDITLRLRSGGTSIGRTASR